MLCRLTLSRGSRSFSRERYRFFLRKLVLYSPMFEYIRISKSRMFHRARMMPEVAHSVCGRLRELLLQGRLCSQLGQRRLCDSVRLPQRARHLHSQSSVTTLCALHRGRERGGWATSTGIPALRASATASPAPSRGRIRVRPLPSRQYSLASGGSSATPDGAAGVFAFMSLYRTAPAPPGRASATCFGSSPASASERSMTAERSSPARGSVAAQRAAEKKLPFRKTS